MDGQTGGRPPKRKKIKRRLFNVKEMDRLETKGKLLADSLNAEFPGSYTPLGADQTLMFRTYPRNTKVPKK